MSTVATRTTTIARATRLTLDELDRARIVPTHLSAGIAPRGTVIVSVEVETRADAELMVSLLNLHPLQVTGSGSTYTTGRPFAGIDMIVAVDVRPRIEVPADCESAMGTV